MLKNIKANLVEKYSDNSKCFNIGGFVFPNDKTIINKNIAQAIVCGWYEQEERLHLPGIFNKNEIVLELGTGLGLISTICASDNRVDHVVTVEANPKLIPYIRKVHKQNSVSKKINLINAVALPNPEKEVIEFFIRDDFWASSLDNSIWGYSESKLVPTINLNQLIENIDPTLLIVDIEGGELTLFDDINFRNIQKIYIELHQQVLGRDGMKKVFDIFSVEGFHYDQWHSTGGVVTFSKITRDSYEFLSNNKEKPKFYFKIKPIYGRTEVENENGEKSHIEKPLRLRGTVNNNLLYSLNAKAACTTFLNFLVLMENGNIPYNNLDVHYKSPKNLLSWRTDADSIKDIIYGKNPYLFTFVRDPYERFLSGFFDKIVAEHDQNYTKFRNLLRDTWDMPAEIDQGNVEKAIDNFLNYLVDKFEKNYCMNVKDPHFNPQSWNINLEELEYDYIGTIENIENDLNEISKYSRKKADISSLFRKPMNKTDSSLYKSYKLTTKQYNALNYIYRVDFDNFSEYNAVVLG